MKKVLVVAFSILVGASSAFAAGYGEAGCGLGAVVFQNKPGSNQIVAATLNGLVGNQSFAVTSGTSNCDAEPKLMAESRQEQFVQNNFTSLAKDMAAGEGENLAAFAELLGCGAENEKAFGALMQSRYAEIVGDDHAPSAVVAGVKQALAAEPELASRCAL
jgi:hypothetical protein